MVLITNYLIEQGKSDNGGWSIKQVNLLGINELYKGWKNDAIGMSISHEKAFEFLLLRNEHIKK